MQQAMNVAWYCKSRPKPSRATRHANFTHYPSPFKFLHDSLARKNKVCIPCSATWFRLALTVPNWIHSLLHRLPLRIFVAYKMAFSKADVMWSSARLIKFNVWNHHRSCRDKFIRGRNSRSTMFGLHRKLFKIPSWEINGKIPYDWEKTETRNSTFGIFLGSCRLPICNNWVFFGK